MAAKGCLALAAVDAAAARLCEIEAERSGGSVAGMDGTSSRIDYGDSGSMPISIFRNGRVEPAEVYQSYLRDAFSRPLRRDEIELLRSKFGCGVPWAPDARHRKMIRRLLSLARADASADSRDDDGATSVFRKVSAVYSLIRLSRRDGGLGLVYRDHLLPEADIDGVIDRGFARCSEFTTLFVGMARMMGLDAYPLEVPQKLSPTEELPHSAAMVLDPDGQRRLFVDLQHDGVLLESPYESYYVGTESDLFATYLVNRSMVRRGDDLVLSPGDGMPLLSAESVAPSNAMLLFAIGAYHFIREDGLVALEYFRRAVRARPDHGPAKAYIRWLSFD